MNNQTYKHKSVRPPFIALTSTALALLIVFSLSASGWGVGRGTYSILPEYERRLDKVVLSLAVSTDSLSLHRSIIESMPDYTEVLILTPHKNVKEIGNNLRAMEQSGNVRLIPFDSRKLKNTNAYVLSSREHRLKTVNKPMSMPSGSIWAQDLFEVVRGENGKSSILTPYLHKWFIRPGRPGERKLISDNSYIGELLSPGLTVESLPLVFKGGNVLVDEFKGRRIAFCGGDVLRETQMVYKSALGRHISGKEIISKMKRYLNVDQVIVIGASLPQPHKLFHLDQAMVLLPGGTAGVTRIIDGVMHKNDTDIYSINIFLDELRAKLRELGYRIVDMDATVADALDYRYYVNGVPYVNSTTGKREFLLPTFDSSEVGINREIYKNNVSALERLGYRVIPVHTHANEHHGGIHCMLNVIS